MMHAASLARSPRLQRVHALLADQCPHSTLDIIATAGVCAVNSIIAELRANGAEINCFRTMSPTGPVWFYQLAFQLEHQAGPAASDMGGGFLSPVHDRALKTGGRYDDK